MRSEHFILVLAILMPASVSVDAESAMTVFSCAPKNDLYHILEENGIRCPRHDTPIGAIEAAPEGAGVLLLSDDYPAKAQEFPARLFEMAREKRLRLYVEYPGALPGLEVGAPRDSRWERGVIVSDAFGPTLKPMRIVGINDCHFVPINAARPHIVLAKVAGFDAAVYGLPREDVWPILFEHPGGSILVSSTKLSQFVTARYGPKDAWLPIWKMILNWIEPGRNWPVLKWNAVVRPSYGADEPLPDDAERRAIRRACEWVVKARMLIHESWLKENWHAAPQERSFVTEKSEAANADRRFELPLGDGGRGILEGFASRIRYDGSQPVRWSLRTDCTGEHIAPFALAGILLEEPAFVGIGSNLANFVLFEFDKGSPWRDPAHPAFGLLGWACSPTMERPVDQTGSFYGVISARVCLSTLAAAAALNDGRWDDRVLEIMLGNFRTTGTFGLRPTALNPKALQEKGWRHYFMLAHRNLSPTPTAQLLAANLATYAVTGYGPLLERTRLGLRTLMEGYPDQWRWWNGLQQERARLLLPLAWLVRVDDSPQHREWLRRITSDFLAHQVRCGAVGEELGPEGKGQYPAPQSNEAYGTAESSLIQENGNPVCDLLYTLNSGFLGLHEAAAAVDDDEWRKAEDRLAAFLCRIQTRSERRPELDGAWFRAFDFGRWDYWASNADAGWGAWCVQTGWVQGWLATTFALREMRTTLWDLIGRRTLAPRLDKKLKQLLPDGVGTGPEIRP